MEKGEFIFIGGTGRSGTTILSKVLQSNENVNRLPFELRIHVDPFGLYDLYRNLTKEWDAYRGSVYSDKFKHFFFKLIGFSFHSYHNISLNSESKNYYKNAFYDFFRDLGIKEERRLWIGNSPFFSKALSMTNWSIVRNVYPTFFLTAAVSEETFLQSSELFFKRILQPQIASSTYLIEHTPYNFLYFDFLSKVFPKSKFIHIKRNPLDIISSYNRQHWGSIELERNVRQIIALYNQWSLKSSGLSNYLEISLEDLAKNSEAIKIKLGQYLGIKPSDLNTRSIDQEKLHIDRWRSDIEFFKTIPRFDELKELCERLGYEVTL